MKCTILLGCLQAAPTPAAMLPCINFCIEKNIYIQEFGPPSSPVTKNKKKSKDINFPERSCLHWRWVSMNQVFVWLSQIDASLEPGQPLRPGCSRGRSPEGLLQHSRPDQQWRKRKISAGANVRNACHQGKIFIHFWFMTNFAYLKQLNLISLKTIPQKK